MFDDAYISPVRNIDYSFNLSELNQWAVINSENSMPKNSERLNTTFSKCHLPHTLFDAVLFNIPT